MGSVIKYVAVYERPFWREAGFSGEVVSDTGITVTTFDDSSPTARHAALVTFSDGRAAAHWSDRTAGRAPQAAVLAEFVRFFGPEAARPIAFAEKNWNDDPWSRGCYVGVAGPGTLTGFGEALREPCGRIHWSGTETATEWMGYLDGAIQSGELRRRRGAEQVENGDRKLPAAETPPFALSEDIQWFIQDFLHARPGQLVGTERTGLAFWRNTMAQWRTRLACYRNDMAMGRTGLAFLRWGLGFVAVSNALMRIRLRCMARYSPG